MHFFPTSTHSSTQSSPLSVVRSKRKKSVNENTDQNDIPEKGHRKYSSNTLSTLQTLDYSIHEIRDEVTTVNKSLLPGPEDSKTTRKNSVYIHVQTLEQKTQDILQTIERLCPSMACHTSGFGVRLTTTQPRQELNQWIEKVENLWQELADDPKYKEILDNIFINKEKAPLLY